MKRSVIDNIKPEVRAIGAYTLTEYDYEVKINQNENPDDVPMEMKREILDYALERSWSRYPPFVPDALHERLAEYAGWRQDGVLVGNGSNEIIQALIAVFIKQGERLILPSPTFTVYRLVGTVFGAEVVEVPLKSDLTFDCDALERAFLDNGAMLIICSPNNPTGCLYPMDRLEKLLGATDKPVVVDEAYFEFSGVTAVDLLSAHDNLIVLRTFSKAFSLAGLRVGYGLMNPGVAKEVGKAKLPYNLNFITMAAAEMLLDRRNQIDESVRTLISERERLTTAMNAIEGVTVYPSKANYILFETPHDPETIFNGVLDDGLLIRNVSSYPMLDKALRVSVSTSADNDRFLVSLARVMKEQ